MSYSGNGGQDYPPHLHPRQNGPPRPPRPAQANSALPHSQSYQSYTSPSSSSSHPPPPSTRPYAPPIPSPAYPSYPAAQPAAPYAAQPTTTAPPPPPGALPARFNYSHEVPAGPGVQAGGMNGAYDAREGYGQAAGGARASSDSYASYAGQGAAAYGAAASGGGPAYSRPQPQPAAAVAGAGRHDEWRESSFISSFYGSSTPEGPSPTRAEYTAPPPSQVQQQRAQVGLAEGPAYPAYAIARTPSAYSAANYSRPTAQPHPQTPPQAQAAYPSSSSSASYPSHPHPHPSHPAPRATPTSGSYASPSRASDDSARYSIYSYHSSEHTAPLPPASSTRPVPSSSTHVAATGFVAQQHYPSRKQSLEQFSRTTAGTSTSATSSPSPSAFSPSPSTSYRQRLDSLTLSSPSPPLPPSTSSTSSSANLSPRPTILMSPPLDGPSFSPSLSPSLSLSGSTSPGLGTAEAPQELHRNRSIDSSWSSLPSSSSTHPAFTSLTSSSGLGEGSEDISRRPSYATLSPDTSYASHTGSGSGFGAQHRAYSMDSFAALSSSSLGGGGGEREEDPARFVNPALLSNLAVWLGDRLSAGAGGGGGGGGGGGAGGYSGAEIVDVLCGALPLPPSSSASPSPEGVGLGVGLAPPSPSPSPSASPSPGADGAAEERQAARRATALHIARSLQSSLWIHEQNWSDAPLLDSAEAAKGAYVLTREEMGETAIEVETPTGVVTEMTQCYSPLCAQLSAEADAEAGAAGVGGQGIRGGCYSASCPRRGKLDAPSAENWASSVPSHVLESLGKKEIARQNQIFELIQGEAEYEADLGLVETGFVQPLRSSSPPILPPQQLSHFLTSVLLNLSSIHAHSSTFLAALRAKQAEAPVVSGIGKIVFSAAVEWAQDYVAYTVGYPMAEFELKEKSREPGVEAVLMDFRRLPSARKRGFDTFHSRPTFRLLRYLLLLEQILKNTDEDDVQEREYLQQAMALIKEQGAEANRGIEGTKREVRRREMARDLVKKQGDTLDLDLLAPDRQFFLAGKVCRRPEGSGFTADQFQEAQLVLFDNYLILTKPPRDDRDGHKKYYINRRPVPLDLVQLRTSSFSEPPIPRSSGFHLRSNRSAGGGGSYSAGMNGASLSPVPEGGYGAHVVNGGPPGSAAGAGGMLYPLTFYQLGRFDGLVHFYVSTPSERAEWETALKAAISLRQQRAEASRVVRLDPLADQTFGTSSIAVGRLTTAPGTQQGNQFGKPTCSVPLRTVDGLWLIVAGCAEGIFFGWRGRPKTMQQVVHLAGITQCAVLPEFSFLLVIANKVLVAYALEALIPSKTGSKLDQASKAPQRLSGQKDVSFFKVGKIGDQDPRTLVIYAKKSGVKESVFKALEPVSQADRARGGGGAGHRFLGLGSGRPEWFRTYKEFFMPSLVTGLHFQRSKLALIGSRGVEIMDLESMRTMTVPDFPSRGSLAKRCEDASTMGMFRIADSRFLLAYSEFAFHVGRHGEPLESGPFIEWESKPEQVAYCAPYIFAISPTLVEIRNAFTGKLVQFITGSHMYLTYDGSAIPSPPRVGSLDTAQDDPAGPVEKRLHLSIRKGQFHVLHEVVVVA
ncbi:hypothetical protein JCM10213_007445 [Rhodosporidiobolus nylandii]